MKPFIRPLIRMTWNDASDSIEPWISEEEMEKFADSHAPVESVGYLVKKTRTHVVIAGDWQEDHKIWGRVTKVPRKMVVSIEEIPLDAANSLQPEVKSPPNP